jgi:hypothetical protein
MLIHHPATPLSLDTFSKFSHAETTGGFMNRFTHYLLAATIAVSGVTTFAADNLDTSGANSAAAQLDRSADRAGDHLQQLGSAQANESTSREARMALARLVNDALTPNHFNNLGQSLAHNDQTRFSNASNINTDDLNRVINQFRQDFRAKYNQDFDAKPENFQDALVYGGQNDKSVTVSLNDASRTGNAAGANATIHDGMHHSNTGMNSNLNSSSNMSASAQSSMNTTGATPAPADRQLNTYAGDTQSNRNGALSASDTSSSTLGNRTGPASSGNNSNSVVRGNDPTANPGVAANTADGAHMTTSNDISRSAVGTDINSSNASANANINNNMNTTGITGAPADRQLNTAAGDTQSNRNGALSASDTSSTTLGNRTGPASSGNNSNSVVRGNDVTANPGVASDKSVSATSITRESLASSNTTPAAGSTVTLHFTNDGGAASAWHLDAQDQLSAQQLKDNLVRHIQMLDDQKSTWPTDVNDAYKTTAFHVLQAFNDSSIASER